jgi:8-oxo-dGTP pyrophosphatase MutT (NUDIX family)
MLTDSDIKARLRHRLHGSQPSLPGEATFAGLPLDYSPAIRALIPTDPVRAAVLVPVVDRPQGLSVLMTKRASGLRTHGGQIAFPGGRIEASDSGPQDAALRESFEEIGLQRSAVEVLGFLQDSLIGTGYCITPVVGLVRLDAPLVCDPLEVASVFEIPLARILDPSQHHVRTRELAGHTIDFHEFEWDGHRVWGATAGLLIKLYRLLSEA